jgi:peptide/nickel transport system substrate-binding protein
MVQTEKGGKAMFKKKSLFIGLSILLVLFLAVSAVAKEPKYGGTLVWRVGAETASMDPHVANTLGSTQLLSRIYSTLLRYDESANVVPYIAESWKVSEDGLTYTFKLRNDVYFHNGRKLTSADIKYNIERMIDPATGSPRASRFNLVNKIETPDEYTVVFTLKDPFAPFLGNFADPNAMIIPREIVEDESIKKKAVGTGPFMIKEMVPGDYVLLEKNPKYFVKGLPYLDQLKLKLITENSAIAASMRSKAVDFTVVWGAMYKFFDKMKNIRMQDVPVFAWAMLEFNSSKPPFDNAKLRLALAYAIDRQEIIDAVMLGNAKVTAPVPEGMKGYSADWKTLAGYQVDLEKAKALLKEAGYPDGLKFELKTSTAYAPYVPTAQVIQSNLKKIGVEAEIIPLEWGAYIKDITNFDTWVACFHSFPSYTADPDAYLYRWFHSKGAWNIGFSDPVVDELLDLGRRLTDVSSRQMVYRRAQVRLAQLAPAVYTWRTRVSYAMQPYVNGVTLTPPTIYFDGAWLDK